ncbi:MAG: HAMP domain-containing histidine kinase [Chloroflexi bacterium]|nr:HAMP domain-containing histidine kinase [Chloroflexota bacterium]
MERRMSGMHDADETQEMPGVHSSQETQEMPRMQSASQNEQDYLNNYLQLPDEQFVQTFAHDVRAKLGLMAGYLSILDQDLAALPDADIDELRNYSAIALQQVDVINRLFDVALEYDRIRRESDDSTTP